MVKKGKKCITISLPDKYVEKLVKVGQELNKTKSQIIQDLIFMYLIKSDDNI